MRRRPLTLACSESTSMARARQLLRERVPLRATLLLALAEVFLGHRKALDRRHESPALLPDLADLAAEIARLLAVELVSDGQARARDPVEEREGGRLARPRARGRRGRDWRRPSATVSLSMRRLDSRISVLHSLTSSMTANASGPSSASRAHRMAMGGSCVVLVEQIELLLRELVVVDAHVLASSRGRTRPSRASGRTATRTLW